MNKLFLFVCCVYCVLGKFAIQDHLLRRYRHHRKPVLATDAIPQPSFISQKVDHFCATCETTFFQRYFVNTSFYQPGGPVFLCVGGEGPALTGWSVVSSNHCNVMVELAPEMNAMLLSLEHRYYGKSVPTEDLKTENLQWLSSHQAQADLANFVQTIGERMNLTEAKWVTFGGSYPGMMAGWARLKYPTLIHASIASSAPVQAEVNMVGYCDVMGDSISAEVVGGSRACYNNVADGHGQIQDMLLTATGQEELKQRFNLCTDVDLNDLDTQRSFAGFGVIYIDIQGNDPSCKSSFCNIEKVCNAMVNQGGNPLDNLAKIASAQNGPECVSFGGGEDDLIMNTTISENSWIRVWQYQTCAQFAFYQTCEEGTRCPFTQGLMTLNSYLDVCSKAFGISPAEVQTNVDFSNAISGGNNPQGTRIMWPNGSIDPWYNLSVLQPPNKYQETLWVNGASHHFWTHPSKSTDSQDVVAARTTIRNQVKSWLQED